MANGRGMLTSAGQTICLPCRSLPAPGGCFLVGVSVGNEGLHVTTLTRADRHTCPSTELPALNLRILPGPD